MSRRTSHQTRPQCQSPRVEAMTSTVRACAAKTRVQGKGNYYTSTAKGIETSTWRENVVMNHVCKDGKGPGSRLMPEPNLGLGLGLRISLGESPDRSLRPPRCRPKPCQGPSLGSSLCPRASPSSCLSLDNIICFG